SGCVDAYYHLGTAYTSGEVVPRDLDRAFALFKFAADRGHMQAQQDLDAYGV
ncbi:MAG: hypothetical protein ACTSX8_04860, partial [Alphaproteobacteria bacterium]